MSLYQCQLDLYKQYRIGCIASAYDSIIAKDLNTPMYPKYLLFGDNTFSIQIVFQLTVLLIQGVHVLIGSLHSLSYGFISSGFPNH